MPFVCFAVKKRPKTPPNAPKTVFFEVFGPTTPIARQVFVIFQDFRTFRASAACSPLKSRSFRFDPENPPQTDHPVKIHDFRTNLRPFASPDSPKEVGTVPNASKPAFSRFWAPFFDFSASKCPDRHQEPFSANVDSYYDALQGIITILHPNISSICLQFLHT